MQEIRLRIKHDEIVLTTNNEKSEVGEKSRDQMVYGTSLLAPLVGRLREERDTNITDTESRVLGTASTNDEAVTLMTNDSKFDNDNGATQSYEAYLKLKEETLNVKEQQFVGQLERAKELLGKRGLNVRAMNYILTGKRATRPSKKATQRRKA